MSTDSDKKSKELTQEEIQDILTKKDKFIAEAIPRLERESAYEHLQAKIQKSRYRQMLYKVKMAALLPTETNKEKEPNQNG